MSRCWPCWVAARWRRGARALCARRSSKLARCPAELPDRYIVVKPPKRHFTDYYVDLCPHRMESTYFVWGETQSDKLPNGMGFDDVLEPIFREIARALMGTSIPIETPDALGGRVLQFVLLDAYNPSPATLTGSVKVAQMGHAMWLHSTV